MASTLPTTADFDGSIQSQLVETSRRLKAVDALAGAISWAGGVLFVLLLATMVDHWLLDLGGPGRLLAFSTLLVLTGWFIVRKGAPLLLRRINPVYAAKSIEGGAPQIKNSLINYLLLKGQRESTSAAVLDVAAARAASDLRHANPETSVDRTHVVHATYWLAAIVVGCGLHGLISPKSTFATFQRVLMPWGAWERPTRVNIDDVQPGDGEVLRGRRLSIDCRVRGLRDGERPRAVYSSASGQIVDQSTSMELKNGRWIAAIPPEGASVDLRYHIEAGDGRSPVHALNVLPVPTVSVELVQYEPPAYTGLARSSSAGGDVRGVEFSRVTIRAMASDEIARAKLHLHRSDGSGEFLASLHAEGREATGQFQLECVAGRPKFDRYHISYETPKGHASEAPVVHSIEILADEPPVVAAYVPAGRLSTEPATRRRGPGNAILIAGVGALHQPAQAMIDVAVDGELVVEVRASDPDYGLSSITLKATRNNGAPIESRRSQQGPRGYGVRGDVVETYRIAPARLGMQVGDELICTASAEDNRQLAAGSNAFQSTSTEPFRVRIVPGQTSGAPQSDGPLPSDGPRVEQGASRPDPARNEQPSPDGSTVADPPSPSPAKPIAGDEAPSAEDSKGSESGSETKQTGDQGDQGNQGDQGDRGEGDPGDQGAAGEQGQDPSRDGPAKQDDPQGAGDPQQSQPGNEGPQNQTGAEGDNGDMSGAESGTRSGDDSADPNGGSQGGSRGQGSDSGQGNSGEASSGHGNSSQGSGESSSAGQGTSQANGSAGTDSDAGAGAPSDATSPSPGEPLHDGEVIEMLAEKLAQQQGSQQAGAGNQNDAGSEGVGSQSNRADDGQGSAAPSQTPPKPGDSRDGNRPEGEGQQTPAGNDLASGQDESNTKMGAEPGTASGGNPQGGAESPRKSPDPRREPAEGAEPRKGEHGDSNDAGSSNASQPASQGNSPTPKETNSSSEASQEQSNRQGDNTGAAPGDRSGGTQPGAEPGEAEQEGAQGGGGKQGGGKQGGGKQGGGKTESTVSNEAGSHGSGDQGAGAAPQSAPGESESNTGDKQQADGAKGQSGNESGAGTSERSEPGQQAGGEGKGAQPSSNTTNGSVGESSGEKASAAVDAGDAFGGGQAASEPSKPGDSTGTASAGEPGQGSGGGSVVNPGGSRPPRDQANLEYARKATDLVLEYLEDQELRPDPKLLKELGWTEDDLRAFLDRWRKMKAAAARDADAARRLDDALSGLGIRSPAPGGRDETGRADSTPQLDGALQTLPPARYRDKFRSFRQRRSAP
ncbi:MAG: hypothetical protein KDB14_12435 [Planctomycetales bacterium]|nr:hypothetical protein [Planctomycetales bacterium]